MSADKVIYCYQHILNNQDKDNWKQDITNYLEYAIESFGNFPEGCGIPLFLQEFIEQLLYRIENNKDIRCDVKQYIKLYFDDFMRPAASNKKINPFNLSRVAAAGVPRPVDIGSFNDRYFIYVAAFGAFTDVAYSTPQPVKNIFGHLAYVLEGATRLGSIQAYPLTVERDGGVEEGGFCYGMVSNTVSVGGFKGMPAEPVRLDDGLFEVVLVRQPQNPLQLQAVIKALLTMSPDEGGLVTSFRTSRLRVACGQELPWTLDGEFGGTPAVAEIVNRQKAVTIVYGK